ncbi:hypothetical protein GCM10010405_54990 [Streptomyces macrosporus]|uniref:Uncharacterized protein n=1 Tax=Streptomyces macrosporus TaxID=44032 RepID=A0ABP5XPD4_9ACTN
MSPPGERCRLFRRLVDKVPQAEREQARDGAAPGPPPDGEPDGHRLANAGPEGRSVIG